jgi:hypothetical protein
VRLALKSFVATPLAGGVAAREGKHLNGEASLTALQRGKPQKKQVSTSTSRYQLILHFDAAQSFS